MHDIQSYPVSKDDDSFFNRHGPQDSATQDQPTSSSSSAMPPLLSSSSSSSSTGFARLAAFIQSASLPPTAPPPPPTAAGSSQASQSEAADEAMQQDDGAGDGQGRQGQQRQRPVRANDRSAPDIGALINFLQVKTIFRSSALSRNNIENFNPKIRNCVNSLFPFPPTRTLICPCEVL